MAGLALVYQVPDRAGARPIGAAKLDAAMTALGYVVLARRPGSVEPVSAVFPGTARGLEQAQNAAESCEVKIAMACHSERPEDCHCPEYVVGEISEWSGPMSTRNQRKYALHPGLAIERIDALESALRQVWTLVATWAVDDDTYLHLDGQDLGYADAAVQITAILDGLT